MLGLSKRKRSQRKRGLVMLPSWIVVLSAIELIGFLALALGITTAAPEQSFVGARSKPAAAKAR